MTNKSVWAPREGGTLFIMSGPKGEHLHVIAFEAKTIKEYKGKQVLLLPLCSIRDNSKTYHDSACEISAGEHAFIKHASYIDYRNARIEAVDHLRALVNNGVCREGEPVTPVLLKRI